MHMRRDWYSLNVYALNKTYIHTQIKAHKNTHSNTCIHMRTLILDNMYIHTHVHTHMHTYVQGQFGLNVSDPDFKDYGFDKFPLTVNLTCM